MNLFTSFKIAGSAMTAQRIRLNTISSNLANVETTHTPEGGPYRKKSVYFEAAPLSFEAALADRMGDALHGVRVAKILEDRDPPKLVYDPSHPDANEEGYVAMPNVEVLEEMVDMMSATRSYEANATVVESAKRMALKALEIGR